MPGAPFPPDDLLWSQTQAGHPGALTLLYERHASAVFNHCYQRVLSRSDAEDLTAEVFLAALQTGSRVQVFPDVGILPWLLGVANNLLRRHRVAQMSASRLRDALAAHRADVPDVADALVAAAADRYHLTLLAAVLSGLPAQDRDIIQLCVLQGLSPGVVAELTGRRPGTVRSRLSRALSRARRQLTQLEAAGSAAEMPAATATATTVTTSERSMPR